jgi:uncharacterized damage-inducible protein DinB
MIQHPQPDEAAPYYFNYINRVPQGADLFALLAAQPGELRGLLQAVTEGQANARPQPGEWSVKEVLGHLNDTERIFAYRALRIARGDTTPLAGFEQDDYVRGTDFNRRTLADLLDEFAAQRQANVLCFKALTAAESERRGTASNNPISTRACLYILVGHVLHHMESLRVDYKVGG